MNRRPRARHFASVLLKFSWSVCALSFATLHLDPGMESSVYRYRFPPSDDMAEVEASLVLSLYALEHLHGEPATRLEARTLLDADQRRCVVDAGTVVGRDLSRLFTGFLIREFGPDAFDVERAEPAVGAA